MRNQQSIGWALVTMVICSTITTTLGYPNPPQVARSLPQGTEQQLDQDHQQLYPQYRPYPNYQARQDDDRKFAEKPNAMKKVALDDIDDIQTNQIHDTGFSWSNMLGMPLHLLYIIIIRRNFINFGRT